LIAALGMGAGLVLLLASLLLMRRRRRPSGSPVVNASSKSARVSKAATFIDERDAYTVEYGDDAADPSGELPVVATDHVDLDVGMPVDTGVPADRLADEETGTLPSMPIDDEKHTVTIVELDLLRQDYEEEFTRTQELSQEVLEAVANLEAARAAHAAETVTSEMPRYPESEGPNSHIDSDAAPPRAKQKK
jgi:hypothetical protein